MARGEAAHAALWPGLIALASATGYLIALLAAEKQALIIALLAAGIAAVARRRLAADCSIRSAAPSPSTRTRSAALRGRSRRSCVAAFFHEDHFVLLLVITVLLYTRGDARAEHPVRLCRRAEFRRRLVLRHRRLHLGRAQRAHRGAASARAADRRPAGGADRLAAAAAGAAHARALCRGGDHRLRAAAQDLPRGQRRARRPAGHAGAGHENLRLVVQRQYRDRRRHAVVLHELFRGQPAAAGRRLRPGAAAGALLDRAQSRRAAARRDGGELLRARHRALEDHRVPDRQFPHRHCRRAVRHGRRLRRAEQLHLRRLAHPGVDPAARRHRQSLGPGRRDHHRRGRAGEAADDPGIPLPALCARW